MNPIDQDDPVARKAYDSAKKSGINITYDEVFNFIHSVTIISSKAVLSALLVVIDEGELHGCDAAEGEKLHAEVEALMKYKHCGYMSCEMEAEQLSLNVHLCLVERNYKLDIMVPDGYQNETCSIFLKIKEMANEFWKQFSETNKDLVDRIANYRANIDFSQLQVDPNSRTTMYFDPESKSRIGIFTYYKDKQGRVLKMQDPSKEESS